LVIYSIVGLSSYLCLSSYNIHPNVHRLGGRDHVSVVFICYSPANTLYILGHVIDRGCDTPVESFVVHSPNIGHKSRPGYEGRERFLYSNFAKQCPLCVDTMMILAMITRCNCTSQRML
jgi:hypothetical protein